MPQRKPTMTTIEEITLDDLRELLSDLYHEIDNVGDDRTGKLFANAHHLITLLLAGYLNGGHD